jgi:hypothetical protein
MPETYLWVFAGMLLAGVDMQHGEDRLAAYVWRAAPSSSDTIADLVQTEDWC